MKRISILTILCVAALAVVLTPGMALANFGIHGSYTMDTDACAGCHRAHTAVSSVQWSDQGNNSHSGLLVSSATEMYEFCYACHDGASQGADTNVQDGVYEGSVYGTQSAPLNGGGFGSAVGLDEQIITRSYSYNTTTSSWETTIQAESLTSTHMYNGASWGAYGGGLAGSLNYLASADVTAATGETITVDGDIYVGTSNLIEMTCTSCHDPHGSSNYRLLNDYVNGWRVGGYDGGVNGSNNPTPTPYVTSAEVGYPQGGFRLHTTYPTYTPDYTEPKYAKPSDASKGMVGWCVGCHTVYASKTSTYNAGDGWGATERHRHPMNVPMSNFNGDRSLIVTDLILPLAHNAASELGTVTNTSSDWIDCLACHVAHGSSAIMTGYANVNDATSLQPNSGVGGVDPSNDSALLRLDNRGVCEVCHNK